MCSVFKASAQNCLHGGSVQTFNQCGPMLAIFVFAPLLTAMFHKGARSPVMSRSNGSQPGAGCHMPCCGFLVTTHMCFDLFSHMHPQYKLPPAESGAAWLPGQHLLALLVCLHLPQAASLLWQPFPSLGCHLCLQSNPFAFQGSAAFVPDWGCLIWGLSSNLVRQPCYMNVVCLLKYLIVLNSS